MTKEEVKEKAKKYAHRKNVEEFDSCNELEIADGYVAGYEQAEKDAELTWLDISRIRTIIEELRASDDCDVDDFIGFCGEVARLFNKTRNK